MSMTTLIATPLDARRSLGFNGSADIALPQGEPPRHPHSPFSYRYVKACALFALVWRLRGVPTSEGDKRPDCLDDAEWPGSREEAVGAGERTAARKRKDELPSATLQGVHEHHECDGDSAERGEHARSLALMLSGQDCSVCVQPSKPIGAQSSQVSPAHAARPS